VDIVQVSRAQAQPPSLIEISGLSLLMWFWHDCLNGMNKKNRCSPDDPARPEQFRTD
jgi:hypothetical protein